MKGKTILVRIGSGAIVGAAVFLTTVVIYAWFIRGSTATGFDAIADFLGGLMVATLLGLAAAVIGGWRTPLKLLGRLSIAAGILLGVDLLFVFLANGLGWW